MDKELLFNKKYGITTLEYNADTHQWHQTSQENTPTRNVPNVGNPSNTWCSYSGRLFKGKPTGYGILHIDPLSAAYIMTYSGWWRNGRYNGQGTLSTMLSSHSENYSGHFKNGLKHGFGKESSISGIHIGYWKNDELIKKIKNKEN